MVIVIDMVWVQNLVAPFCRVLGKDMLRDFPCWSWQAVLNFNHISIEQFQSDSNSIPWYLRKRVGIIACPMY